MRIQPDFLMLAVCGLSFSCAGADDTASKRVALLVGVNEYLKPGFKPLQFAEADVIDVGEELKKLGFSVTVLLGSGKGEQQATQANIDAAARQMVAPLGKDDLALVMLSGHGQQLSTTPDLTDFTTSESFFCPVDAVVNDHRTQFSLSLLLDEILAPNVGRKMLLVDACRDIPVDVTRGGRNTKGIEGRVIALPEETAVYFSCRAGQISYERHELQHGLFTHCLLDGLRGGAASASGDLSWSRIVAFVDDRMQHPDLTKHMPAALLQVPIPAGAMPYTVLGRVQPKPAVVQPLLPVQSTPPAVARATPQTPLVLRVAPPPKKVFQRPADPLIAPFTAQQVAGACQKYADRLRIPASVTSRAGLRLNLITPGEFTMGKETLGKDDYHRDDQAPEHRVWITRPFYIGVHEVTQKQWTTIIGTNCSWLCKESEYGREQVKGLDTSDCPVESMSWLSTLEFCNLLSQRDGLSPYYSLTKIQRSESDAARSQDIVDAEVTIRGGNGYRLPTEAEWEYACRAGTTTHFHFGDSMNGTQANADAAKYPYRSAAGRFLGRTTSVGRYPPNAFGLYDMHGNVAEWCFDEFETYAYSRTGWEEPVTADTREVVIADPVEAGFDAVISQYDSRVIRGGGYENACEVCGAAIRRHCTARMDQIDCGFRVARDP